jgi:hypothetical protein
MITVHNLACMEVTCYISCGMCVCVCVCVYVCVRAGGCDGGG